MLASEYKRYCKWTEISTGRHANYNAAMSWSRAVNAKIAFSSLFLFLSFFLSFCSPCLFLTLFSFSCYDAVFLRASFPVFPLYAHTRLVNWSGALSLTKSGHSTPSHPSNHYLKLIFFGSPTDSVCVCVCMCVWGWGGDRKRERERELVVYRKVSCCFFIPLMLFHVMGFVLRRTNDTEKNTLLLLLFS